MGDEQNRAPFTHVTGWALMDAGGRVSNFTDSETDAQVWKELGYVVKEYAEFPPTQTNANGNEGIVEELFFALTYLMDSLVGDEFADDIPAVVTAKAVLAKAVASAALTTEGQP